MLPVYTLFLTPEDYGITNLVTSFNSVATFVIAFSLYSAIVRFYADYKDDREKLKQFYGTVIIFVLCSGCIFAGLGFALHELLIEWFFKGIEFYPVIVLALLTLTFICLHTVHQSIMQGLQAGKKLTLINLTVFGLQVGLNLLFIGVFRLGATGVLLASFIINLGYFIYMLYDLRANNLVVFSLNKTLLGEALHYSIPLMPHNLSTHIASFVARVFINNSSSLSSVGLYGIAWQFGSIIDLIQASVNRAFAPWFFETMNGGEASAKGEIIKLSRILLILYSLVYMVIGLFSQEVVILMTNERYLMAWTVIPILVAAFSVKSIYYFYVNVLYYYKQAANKVFIATIAGSFADIVLAVLLVPVYGMYGAAFAFLNAKIIVVAIVVVMSKKYNDIGYRVNDMLKILLPSLLFMWVGLYLSYIKYMTVFSWINLLYKLGVLFAYLIFVYLSNRKEIDRVIKSEKFQNIIEEVILKKAKKNSICGDN